MPQRHQPAATFRAVKDGLRTQKAFPSQAIHAGVGLFVACLARKHRSQQHGEALSASGTAGRDDAFQQGREEGERVAVCLLTLSFSSFPVWASTPIESTGASL